MIQRVFFLIVALLIGITFNALQIPAGWLLGGIITGICWGMIKGKLVFPRRWYMVVLVLVGSNIGLMMERDLFLLVGQYLFPLIVTLSLTLISSFVLGWLLLRWSTLDKRTAFFSCIPGGMSEVISVSGEYGADDRIVAAFHTARVTLFVLFVPLLVVYWEGGNHVSEQALAKEGFHLITFEQITVLLTVMVLSILLHKRWPIPAGAILYALLIAFIIGEFIVPIDSLPNYVPGIGQVLLGAIVGVRFDRATFQQLKSLGFVSLKILATYFLFAILIAAVFWLLTDATLSLSLLSTVPAGAAEMSATAFAIGLEPTLVTSLHIIRVIILFLLLPFLIRWVNQ
ncbi:AbrB family transcriptional regulator [Texcoconibacillus texcoconensis]|uniref:AbrB family transcriptional regulator n=1 Tax=Texcoconibacillus texcoconensis TaxID=1095777 RepID=A0A840QQ74_9BACI|nr:AbrB family transcriptional regulator [Texcoconibacillus texcoconensis]MBB5173499.1 hypothetical protein [Texcoconibacillus texcoconensis]